MSINNGYVVTMRQSDLLKLSLFPITRKVDDSGHLHVGGCDCVELAREFGTPLYVFDEHTLRSKCREFRTEFTTRYANTLIIYAAKAFLNQALAEIINEEGLGLDVVSGGELSVAQLAEFPREKTYFHGNNKSAEELNLALDWRIGRIVVDNHTELELLDRLAGNRRLKQDILLRLNPGVDAHTHRYTSTGILDSKFGFPLNTGQAERAIAGAMSAANLNLVGLHFHLGSPVADSSPYETAIGLVFNFAREMKTKYDFQLNEFSPGGGFAVKYVTDSIIASTGDYAAAIAARMTAVSKELGLPLPKLVVEPGRAIVAQAGIALYTVGSIKEIPRVRKYVFVDGGMGDNIRPALYEAKYEVLVANRMGQGDSGDATIAGRYCESGDILARDVRLGAVTTGDVIAVPVSGAYAIPMASNYNMVPKPAILMVNDGKARLTRRRETYEDLMKLDLV
jgi:diaminopimelate decarboxylase